MAEADMRQDTRADLAEDTPFPHRAAETSEAVETLVAGARKLRRKLLSRERVWRRSCYRGNAYGGGRAYYGGRGYYGPGFGFGVGVYPPYGYAAPACNPTGFYDANGVWQYYPGCAVPYGY